MSSRTVRHGQASQKELTELIDSEDNKRSPVTLVSSRLSLSSVFGKQEHNVAVEVRGAVGFCAATLLIVMQESHRGPGVDSHVK